MFRGHEPAVIFAHLSSASPRVVKAYSCSYYYEPHLPPALMNLAGYSRDTALFIRSCTVAIEDCFNVTSIVVMVVLAVSTPRVLAHISKATI